MARLYAGIFVALMACRADPPAAAPLVEEGPPRIAFATVSLDEAHSLLGQHDVYFFDANPRDMFDRAHVPGARWVKWNDVHADDLPSSHQAKLIFYCANEWCSASHESARLAHALGYQDVNVMARGILGWKKASLPIEPVAQP